MKTLVSLSLAVALLVAAGCEREKLKLTTTSREALDFYSEGLGHWEKFYYTEAKASFEKAIEHDSAFAMAWARLAMVNLYSDNELAAREDITRGMKLAEDATEREQLFIRMINHRVHYRIKEAAEVGDSLIMLYPEDREPYLIRGNIYELNKNIDAAIQSYQKAIALDTSYALAVMSLGYAYSSAGDEEKAIIQMRRYIRLAPQAADPRASYADILARAGRFEEALEQYRKSLELKPDYWYSINRIGDIFVTLGRLNEAQKQYEEGFSLMIHSKQLEASHIAVEGTLQFYRGKYQQAVQLYETALGIDSINGNAAYGLVNALTQLKEFKLAEFVISRIRQELERRNLTESQAMVSFHLMKARLFTGQGLLDQAEEQCDSALDFTSPFTRAAVYRQLAEIKLKQKAFEDAFYALDGALRINPNSPQALLTLTKVYHEKGDRLMTKEIGNRLRELWKDADPDFKDLQELKKILGTRS